MKVGMLTEEEMHADQAEFRLLGLLSNFRDLLWRHSQELRRTVNVR